MTVPAIGFYGFSGSGKTTILVSLIKLLRDRNINCAVIKKTNRSHPFESKEKDTAKFRDAGALITVFHTPTETSYSIRGDTKHGELIQNINTMARVDCVFIEGANSPEIPKIRIGKKPIRENTIADYNGNLDDLLKIVLIIIDRGESNVESANKGKRKRN